MASKLFFDPLVALRAAPLVSSTCTLLYARDQHLFLGLLNGPESRPHSAALLPAYFRGLFRQGVAFVVAMLAATAWTSAANVYAPAARPRLRATGALGWYGAAAALSSAHLLFIPLVAPSVTRICEAKGEGEGEGEGKDVNAALDEWLAVNKLRMLTVDLAAWLACVVAVGKSLSA